MRSKPTEEVEKAFAQGFYELPAPLERSRMSAEQLAILLADLKEGTPAYILISHELNLRIANTQANASNRAAVFGLLGTLLGALITVLGQWLLQSPASPEPDKLPQATTSAQERSATSPRPAFVPNASGPASSNRPASSPR